VKHQSVACERHGEQRATFVCQHLLDGSRKGWVTIASGSDDRPDAICADCDAFWREAGDQWTDELEAQVRIRVVCARCYDELRARHQAP
jgi:hypothetical protein